jgi:hypothetical protein
MDNALKESIVTHERKKGGKKNKEENKKGKTFLP